MAAAETSGRRGRLGQNAERQRIYDVLAATEAEAEGLVVARVQVDLGGLFLDGLPLSAVAVEETKVPGVWKGTATFSARPHELETPRTGFEFSQEARRVKFSLATARYGAKAPDLNGAIGAHTEDARVAVDGVDVTASAFTFSKTKIFPLTAINNAFIADAAALHLHWNLNPFAGFQPGEVLFTGLTGNQRDSTTYECTFRFAQRPNQFGLVIGGIVIPFARGWDEIDVLWETAEDSANAALAPRARGVYVHQVYEGAHFGFLGLE